MGISRFIVAKPSVLSPGLDVNLATSTIFTANCWLVSLCKHLFTTLYGPLKIQKDFYHTTFVYGPLKIQKDFTTLYGPLKKQKDFTTLHLYMDP